MTTTVGRLIWAPALYVTQPKSNHRVPAEEYFRFDQTTWTSRMHTIILSDQVDSQLVTNNCTQIIKFQNAFYREVCPETTWWHCMRSWTRDQLKMPTVFTACHKHVFSCTQDRFRRLNFSIDSNTFSPKAFMIPHSVHFVPHQLFFFCFFFCKISSVPRPPIPVPISSIFCKRLWNVPRYLWKLQTSHKWTLR